MYVVGEIAMNYRTYRKMVTSALGRTMRINQVLGAVVSVALLLLPSGLSSTQGLVTFGGGIFLAASPELFAFLGWRRTAVAAKQPWRYTMTDTTITISTSTSTSNATFAWGGLTVVATRRYMWLMRTATKVRLPIPRAAFTDEDATWIDDFVAAVARSGHKTSLQDRGPQDNAHAAAVAQQVSPVPVPPQPVAAPHPQVLAGWYRDPNGQPCYRWWDGNQWTADTAPLA
jgi:hypothetical protein